MGGWGRGPGAVEGMGEEEEQAAQAVQGNTQQAQGDGAARTAGRQAHHLREGVEAVEVPIRAASGGVDGLKASGCRSGRGGRSVGEGGV